VETLKRSDDRRIPLGHRNVAALDSEFPYRNASHQSRFGKRAKCAIIANLLALNRGQIIGTDDARPRQLRKSVCMIKVIGLLSRLGQRMSFGLLPETLASFRVAGAMSVVVHITVLKVMITLLTSRSAYANLAVI